MEKKGKRKKGNYSVEFLVFMSCVGFMGIIISLLIQAGSSNVLQLSQKPLRCEIAQQQRASERGPRPSGLLKLVKQHSQRHLLCAQGVSFGRQDVQAVIMVDRQLPGGEAHRQRQVLFILSEVRPRLPGALKKKRPYRRIESAIQTATGQGGGRQPTEARDRDPFPPQA